MVRRRLCVAGAVASVLSSLPTSAQRASRMPRVGCLIEVRSDEDKQGWRAFGAEMSRLGWIDGRTVIFEKRVLEPSGSERLDALARELAALNVDVLYVAAGTQGALAAKKATKTIPIVFLSSADPVGLGLVESLGHPGGNLTGSSMLGFEKDPKAIQFLAEATGKLTRVGYLHPSEYRSASFFPLWSAAMIAAAERLGAKMEFVAWDSDAEIVPTLKRLVHQGFDGAMCDVTYQFKLDAKSLSALFVEHRLPTIGDARAGFLLHYYVAARSLDQAAAVYVDKILRGAKPSELPIQQPSKFELAINLKTAKALGLRIPRSLVERADEVIQ